MTRGLEASLTDDELDAVLAHELAHIANRDAVVMTAASVPRTIGTLLVGGEGPDLFVLVWLLLWPFGLPLIACGTLITLTISRYREYAADRGSALITGAPENLMSALQKIAGTITQIPERDLREVAGMNAFFIVPTNWRNQVGELFMDHPPLEKRLAALSEIARQMGRPVA